MSMLEKLLNSDSIKKQLFSKLAKQAKEKGVKRMLITIEDDGEFKADILEDKMMLVEKENYLFLLNRYNQMKAGVIFKDGENWKDTIKP